MQATTDTLPPNRFEFFLPLLKADQEKHTLYARAAAEEPDKSNEIMDYATAVPAFQLWSKQYSDATMGKSQGNVRAMHNPRHLAGKVEKLDYDDNGKFVGATIKVLDPIDWAKVEEGGYTGISIGGGYARKWPDPLNKNLTRYTPRIQEISLVDSPCIPSARIMELQKSDGSTAEILLKGVPRSFADLVPPKTFGELAKMAVPVTLGLDGLIRSSRYPNAPNQPRTVHAGSRGTSGMTMANTPHLQDTSPAALARYSGYPVPSFGKMEKNLGSTIGRGIGRGLDAVIDAGNVVGGRIGRGSARRTFERNFAQQMIHRDRKGNYQSGWTKLTGTDPGEASFLAEHRANRVQRNFETAGGMLATPAAGGAVGAAVGGVHFLTRRKRDGSLAARKQEILDTLEKLTPKTRERIETGIDLAGAGAALGGALYLRHKIKGDRMNRFGAAPGGSGASHSQRYQEALNEQHNRRFRETFKEGHRKLDVVDARLAGMKRSLEQGRRFNQITAVVPRAQRSIGTRIRAILPGRRAATAAILAFKKDEIMENLAKSTAHPGFAAAQSSIERREGYSKDRAGAILAAAARKAGKGALHRNPRLRRVSGVSAKKQEILDNLVKANGLPKAPDTEEAREKIHQTLHEFKHGQLHSFRANTKKKDMPKVTNRRQAIAIALSQARRVGKSEDTLFVTALADRLAKRGIAKGTPSVDEGEIVHASKGLALTEKQHGQRIAAAKARWMREGHPDIDDHHDAVMAQAKRAILGRDGKIGDARQLHDETWGAVHDAQSAYDKVRENMPKEHGLMMRVHKTGLAYNPEGIGYHDFDERGAPKKPIYLLHHHEADDWIRKHGTKAGVTKSTPYGLVEHFDDISGDALAEAA